MQKVAFESLVSGEQDLQATVITKVIHFKNICTRISRSLSELQAYGTLELNKVCRRILASKRINSHDS